MLDKQQVKNKWKEEFEKLYNSSGEETVDQNLNNIKTSNYFREMEMEDPLYLSNDNINGTFSYDEVAKVVYKSKIISQLE